MKVSLENLSPILIGLIKDDVNVELTITGTSMLPLLENGRDSVVLSKVRGKLQVGDITLYKRDNGQYVLHRIKKVLQNEYYLIGDNQTYIEKGITDKHLIAVVTFINRKAKKFSVENFWYKVYWKVWLAIVPIRPVFRKIIMKYLSVFRRK